MHGIITDWMPPIEVDTLEELYSAVLILPEDKSQLALVGPQKVPYVWYENKWVLLKENAWWYPVVFLKSEEDLKEVDIAEGTSRFAVIDKNIFVWHPKLKRWISLDEEICPNCGYFIWE
jgi:hypothetical protein